MYWSAAMSGDDIELRLSIWKSINNHVANVHDGHDGQYTRCLHGSLERRDWLCPGSPEHSRFVSLTTDRCLLKDIAQLSPAGQTYSLESFHAVIIHFASKSVPYTPAVMQARTRLAALHFNENANRVQAVKRSGEGKFKIKLQRAREGHYVACPLNVDATYDYIRDLMEETVAACQRFRTFDEAFAASNEDVPPPMTAHHPRTQSAAELAAIRQKRFCDVRRRLDYE
ncbi:uncharacterized protein LOC135378644 [Ornithodoros turicata]|uniref:uncharacterized protein LOC135378644 n=1 Tax=Ornithodoros turicata TaxID=34597 RepID=UPI00313988E4